MILRFAKRNPGSLFEVMHDLARKLQMAIQSRADRRPTEGELLQGCNRLLRPTLPIAHLLRITTKLLASPNRRRIHQVGPADLDHIVELLCLGPERVPKFFESGNEAMPELFGAADVDR